MLCILHPLTECRYSTFGLSSVLDGLERLGEQFQLRVGCKRRC